jgi:hypothetical protein
MSDGEQLSGPREPLVYQMIMALNAADIGSPICEQAAAICAEIADQHCTERHLSVTAPVIRQQSAAPAGSVAFSPLTSWETQQ